VSALEVKRFAIFAELAASEVEALEELLETSHFDAGQQLFREGQESDGLWLVAEGRVRVEHARAGRLGSLGPGDGMGAFSLIVVGARTLTAVAEEPVTVVRLTRTAFHRLSEDAPRASARILEWIVRDVAAPLRAGLEQLA
jgi:CRP-like cAMP-binding protein